MNTATRWLIQITAIVGRGSVASNPSKSDVNIGTTFQRIRTTTTNATVRMETG
jgi:hypothetical protein